MPRWDNLALLASLTLFSGYFGHVVYAASTRSPVISLKQEAILLGIAVLCFAAGSLGREAHERKKN
ncbi:hypothetical protein [Roseibaca sp. Y0-43]|uniref:hypothetical protein n=1 Tax=Roseibaca sp. Y0-43 TaxID=2816854 RepID=UPI001D0C448A|nr:hypothetical protein [Roseibaca sp. Y0-43]MCC1482465.1 hypothetical protein [Roseibaca sp. Y0-43]